MAYEDIRLEIADRVATLTLARDDRRNTLTEKRVVDEFVDAIERVRYADDASVLVITGEGAAFSAGGNLKDLPDFTAESDSSTLRDWYSSGIQRIPRALASLDRPVIAAVNGPAYGAGCDLALYADMAIGSTRARFCEQFVNLGLIPGDGGTWILIRRIGWQRAADMLFTGRVVGAEEAKAMGILLDVVEPERLMPRVMELAGRIASRPPKSLRHIKELMRHAPTQTLPDHLDQCSALQGILQKTEDHMASLKALLEKRPEPTFKGR